MITIAKGNEKLKVSKDSYDDFFKGIGYKIVEEKKVVNSKKDEVKDEVTTSKKGEK